MRFIKVFLFALTGIILPVCLSAQTVSGKLIDENSQPLPYANVVLLSLPDSAFVSGATSDDKGNFVLKDLSARSYLLQVSYIGYQPQSILLENLDRKINLGDIRLVQDAVSLQGVTVTGSNVMEKIDRQIVIPSSRQIKAATSGYELLSHMQLPGLKVNSIERSISTVSGGSVQLRINDIEASTAQVQALRPDEVLRVEYIDNPDMRYANTDVEAVINYVVKRRESGVAGGFNLTNAVTTGFGNDNVYIKANHKLSEFGFNYYVSYRDYNDRFVNEDQTFSLPDGNRDRYLKGITTPFNYADHYLELNYNLTKPEKYVFNASFTDNLFRSPHNDYGQIIQEEGKNDIYSFTKKINNSNSPSLDLYGKVLLPKDQELVLNMVGTYISSDYERNYNESLTEGGTPYSEYIYSTDGKRYSLIGEGIYKKNFKNVALSGGLKYTLAYTNNKYMGDVNQTDEMHSSDLYGYVQVNGKWKKLSYLLGVGLSRQSYDESGKGYSFYMFRPSASLSYKPFEGATLKYVFSSTPNVPSLSSLSDIRQQLTDIEVNRGNPNLKPYRSYSNTLQLSWGNKWVDLQLKGGYYLSKNPIMEEVNMVAQPDGSYIFEYAPVLERVIDQCIGRNGRYRLIPIPDLYSVQRDFLDSTVGYSIGQLYPVADTQHIIGRKLYPRHKTQNTVFEYQHQYSRRCTQACKQSHRRLIHQHRDYNNAADKEQQYLKNLHKPFHWTVLLLVPCIIYIQHHQQQAVDSEQYGSNDIHRTYFL